VTDWAHMYEEYTKPHLKTKHAAEHHREWSISHIHAGASFLDPALHPTVAHHSAAMIELQHVFTRGGWHAHTWDRESWSEFFYKMQSVVGLKFAIEDISYNGLDMAAALVKV
jgi:hypothetical protein